MDNFDTKTPAQPATNGLQAQVEGLRHLIVSILILVVVVSGTFTVYLLRQWRAVGKELTAYRPQAAQMIADYQKVSVPVMTDFLKKVTDYGRTHPDFVPILTRYNIKPGSAVGGVPAAPASAPAARPKK
ncbi:MAG: hypothetical protein NTX51_05405 [Verrucomicrobia bacterium]|nr:hypothetical protein [Verrucomicrobiota bacterium]